MPSGMISRLGAPNIVRLLGEMARYTMDCGGQRLGTLYIVVMWPDEKKMLTWALAYEMMEFR